MTHANTRVHCTRTHWTPQARTHGHSRTHTVCHARAHTQTATHTHTHTHAHTHTHTHSRTHDNASLVNSSFCSDKGTKEASYFSRASLKMIKASLRMRLASPESAHVYLTRTCVAIRASHQRITLALSQVHPHFYSTWCWPEFLFSLGRTRSTRSRSSRSSASPPSSCSGSSSPTTRSKSR